MLQEKRALTSQPLTLHSCAFGAEGPLVWAVTLGSLCSDPGW